MHSCLANNGVVECYFPTEGAANRNAALFSSAPDLLTACQNSVEAVEALLLRLRAEGLQSGTIAAEVVLRDLTEAIAKAEGQP